MASYTSATRRGLVFTLYAEALLAAGAVAFLALSFRESWYDVSTKVLVWSMVLSGLLGVPAVWNVWGGRREFGGAHEASARRGVLLLALMGGCLFLAFFQVTTSFTDPETGGRLANLRAPWFFLGVALLADAGAIVLLLWNLAGDNGRRWLWLCLAVAAVGAAAYAVVGWRAIEDYIHRVGPQAASPMEARSFSRDFVLDIVRPWVAWLLALRTGFWPALMASITNVVEAEQEADEATQWTPGKSEPR